MTGTFASISVEFTCADIEMMREKAQDLTRLYAKAGLHGTLLGIEKGRLREGSDETMLPEYRDMHGLRPVTERQLQWNEEGYATPGLTTYVARVRLTDATGATLDRARILGMSFGDRDVGMSIDSID